MSDFGFLPLPPDRPVPPARWEQRRRLLHRHVTSSAVPARPRRFGGWRRWLVAGVVAATLAGGGTAAAYVAYAPATETSLVRCYTKASLEGGNSPVYGSDVVHVSMMSVRGATPTVSATPADQPDPIEECSWMWRDGLLVPGSRGTIRDIPANPTPTHPVPPLVACTLHNGIAAVFPGDDSTCAALGLPRLAH
jgi:hypothetical protein